MFSSKLQFIDSQTSTVVGSGTYGKVYKTYYPNTGVLACKITDKDEDDVHHPGTLREMGLLHALSTCAHPNIIQLIGLEFNHCDSLLFHMEYQEINLKHFLTRRRKSFEPEWIINNTIKALHFLHSLGICHRDLKTENILLNLSTNEVKLCDFGLGRFAIEDNSTFKIVSPPYRPPEILTNKKTGIVDMYKVDIWSLGCIIYEIFHKKFLFIPYKSDSRQQKNINDVLTTEGWINKIQNPTNEKYCNVILNCIVQNPTQRTNIFDICDTLEIKVEQYSLIKTDVPMNFKKCSQIKWNRISENFHKVSSRKETSSSTINLAMNYIRGYLNKHTIHSDYETLLIKSAYYLAVRLNETVLPHVDEIFKKDYSYRDINDMEKLIIKSCDGNMWLFSCEKV